MYNRYLSEHNQYIPASPPEEMPPLPPLPDDVPRPGQENSPKSEAVFSSLFARLGKQVSLPTLSLDTVVLVAILYFLLADSEDTELYLLVGAMLIFGL